jgi:hypothetical protein
MYADTEGDFDDFDADYPHDSNVPETFGDGLPCPYCTDTIENHTLSDERDSRGRRIWVCPTY